MSQHYEISLDLSRLDGEDIDRLLKKQADMILLSMDGIDDNVNVTKMLRENGIGVVDARSSFVYDSSCGLLVLPQLEFLDDDLLEDLRGTIKQFAPSLIITVNTPDVPSNDEPLEAPDTFGNKMLASLLEVYKPRHILFPASRGRSVMDFIEGKQYATLEAAHELKHLGGKDWEIFA